MIQKPKANKRVAGSRSNTPQTTKLEDFVFSTRQADAPRRTDNELSTSFNSGDIRILTEQARYYLPTIPAMLETKLPDGTMKFDLDPEYQRRRRWSTEKQSRLIESFILNVPVPPVFLYEVAPDRYEVMDGQQRLTAIYEFYKNRFKLEKLAHWPELEGRTYDKLPLDFQSGINRRYLTSIILIHETSASAEKAQTIKQLVFDRLNSGGVSLTAQEKRNALTNGLFNRMCVKLAGRDDFKQLWRISTRSEVRTSAPEESDEDQESADSPDKIYSTMADVEIVLRFFAYQHLSVGHLQKGWAPFLDAYLRWANQRATQDSEFLPSKKRLFEETLDLVQLTLGKDAFCQKKLGRDEWIDRPQRIVYDPIMRTFSMLLSEKESVIAHRREIKSALADMYEQSAGQFSGRNTNFRDFSLRNELVLKTVKKAMG